MYGRCAGDIREIWAAVPAAPARRCHLRRGLGLGLGLGGGG